MPKIALCICTCNRPAYLRKLLAAVEKLAFDGALRVIVVDNHAERAGMAICAGLAPHYRFPLQSQYESRPGISEARNASFAAALAEPVDFIAMIDDDEFPAPDWLAALLAEQVRSAADVVCGPVVPDFEKPPPVWLAHTAFFKQGSGIKSSNALIRAEALRSYPPPWFDRQLGLSGGEDTKLLLGLIAAGYRFAPCETAIVFEAVPKERLSKSYVLRRSIREGSGIVLFDRQGLLPDRYANLATVFAKFGHGLNHLFWTPLKRERLFDAIRDFGLAIGIALGLAGYRYQFYEEQHGRRAWFVRQ